MNVTQNIPFLINVFFQTTRNYIHFKRKKSITMQILAEGKIDDGTFVYNSPPTPQVDLQYIWLKFTI